MDDGPPRCKGGCVNSAPRVAKGRSCESVQRRVAFDQFYDERRHCAPLQIQLSRQRGPQQGTAKVHLPPCPAQIATPCLYIYTTPPSPWITIGRRSSFGPERQNHLPSRRTGSEIPVG